MQRDSLKLYSHKTLSGLISKRVGEIKIGERFHFINQFTSKKLSQSKQQGVKFVLLGISEDVGPRANNGKGGANLGFEAFIRTFINFQSNQFFNGNECLLLGEILVNNETCNKSADFGEIEQFQAQVASLDNAVCIITQQIIAAGLEPIVIGGGHNNAFGLLSGLKSATKQPAAAVNLDHHSDFRLKEGRHSGNGFSYAAANGSLGYYHILGLHQQKNTQTSLEQLQVFGANWHSFQSIWITQYIPLIKALKEISQQLNNSELPVALELDMDTISNMPASAMTCAGVPLLDAIKYVDYIASHCDCHYLHLAEAAPSCDYHNLDAGMQIIGQALSELVLGYINGRQRYAWKE